VKDLKINFIHTNGQLQKAMNVILIEFRDSTSGKPVMLARSSSTST